MAIRILTSSISHFFKSNNPKHISTFPNSRRLSSHSNSHYRKHISLANLLQRYGFSSSQLNFLSKHNFLLNSSLNDTEKSLAILFSFSIPQSYLSSVIFRCPAVLEFEFLNKWEKGFKKLGLNRVPPLLILSVLEHSRRFQLDPYKFSQIVRDLKGLGFSDGTVSKILQYHPEVVSINQHEISTKIKFLIEVGIPRDEIDQVFYSFPGILKVRVDKLKALLCEFNELGFSQNVIVKEILREPKILGMESGELSRCLQLLKTLKCRVPIKEKIFSKGTFRAGFEAKLRIDCLCKNGFIRREAFKVMWKEPRLILYKTEEIEKKIEFLVEGMKLGVDCLVEDPEYLGVSFEKQIVPRFNVIEYLRSKGAIRGEFGLKEIIRSSRLRFYNLFVKPYPDCVKMFGRLAGDTTEVRSRHPVGLWKLFKPQRFPESREDVKNMRSFME